MIFKLEDIPSAVVSFIIGFLCGKLLRIIKDKIK